MLKKLLFVGMILVLMASFSVVFADQDGHDIWCNIDKYGCWITNEEGGQDDGADICLFQVPGDVLSVVMMVMMIMFHNLSRFEYAKIWIFCIFVQLL